MVTWLSWLAALDFFQASSNETVDWKELGRFVGSWEGQEAISRTTFFLFAPLRICVSSYPPGLWLATGRRQAGGRDEKRERKAAKTQRREEENQSNQGGFVDRRIGR